MLNSEIAELSKILVVITAKMTFFAVCGYGYSRLNFHSQMVSRLDLPTLVRNVIFASLTQILRHFLMNKILWHFKSIDYYLIKSFFDRPPDKVTKAFWYLYSVLHHLFFLVNKNIFFICQIHEKERKEYIRNVFVYCIFWGQICNRYSFNI